MNNESKVNIQLKYYNPLWWISVYLIKFYRIFSSRLPNRCRFYPSCSQYSLDCFEKYGFIRASVKTVIRISKCHPFHPGGVDKA